MFFAVGSSYTPSWNWVWKAYRSLSRKYRKNLKQLVRHFFLSIKCDYPSDWLIVYCPSVVLFQECVLLLCEGNARSE